MKKKYFLARKIYLIGSIISSSFFLLIAILSLMVNPICAFGLIYFYIIVCLPLLFSQLRFIKLTDTQLIYFGLFKKKKMINLDEVKKIEFGYFRKTIDIRFIGKEKQLLIRCLFNINLLEELIGIYNKKIFQLSIFHDIVSKKAMNILVEIFGEKLLEEKDIDVWFCRKKR